MNCTHRRARVFLTLLVTVLCGAGASAQSLPAAAQKRIDDAVAAEQARQKIPGLAIAVAFDNRLIYSRAYGSADLEHGIAAKPTTAFRTASIAKPLTATGLMTLVEAGQLDLDLPIRTYCPAWPEKHPPVTARQVLGHLGGIRHYTRPGESSGKNHYFTTAEALALFKDDALLHAPGSKYSYSTYGYTLLACAIEGASGASYEAFMKERVFTPLEMNRTRVDRVYELIPDRSAGYQVLTEEAFKQLPAAIASFATVGGVYNAVLHDTSMKVAGGGFVSAAEDLVRFGIALNTGRLLKKSTVEQMWTEGKTAEGKGTGYGLGFGVFPAQEGIRRISHSGNQAGAASFLVILPEVGVTYAIMSNLEDAELGTISRGISTALRDTFTPKK